MLTIESKKTSFSGTGVRRLALEPFYNFTPAASSTIRIYGHNVHLQRYAANVRVNGNLSSLRGTLNHANKFNENVSL